MLVLLAICGVALIIAIIALIPRLKNALARVPFIVYILIVLALVAVIAILVINLFGPRGSDSLTSKPVDGIEQGDADIDTDLKEGESGTGTTLTSEEVFSGNEIGDDTVYIRIRGDKITIGGAEVGDIESFEPSMEGIIGGFTGSVPMKDYPICLIDDYATSRTYTAVRDILDGMGLEYTERAE